MDKALSLVISCLFLLAVIYIDKLSIVNIALSIFFCLTAGYVFIKATNINLSIRLAILLLILITELLIFAYSDGINRILLSGAWLSFCYFVLINPRLKIKNAKLTIIINIGICLLLIIPSSDIDGVTFSMPNLSSINAKFILFSEEDTTIQEQSRNFAKHAQTPIEVDLILPRGSEAFLNYKLHIFTHGTASIMISEVDYFENIAFLPFSKAKFMPNEIKHVSVNEAYANAFQINENHMLIENINKSNPFYLNLGFPSKQQIQQKFDSKYFIYRCLIALFIWQLIWLSLCLILPSRGLTNAK